MTFLNIPGVGEHKYPELSVLQADISLQISAKAKQLLYEHFGIKSYTKTFSNKAKISLTFIPNITSHSAGRGVVYTVTGLTVKRRITAFANGSEAVENKKEDSEDKRFIERTTRHDLGVNKDPVEIKKYEFNKLMDEFRQTYIRTGGYDESEN